MLHIPKGLLLSMSNLECQNFPCVQIHQGNVDMPDRELGLKRLYEKLLPKASSIILLPSIPLPWPGHSSNLM